MLTCSFIVSAGSKAKHAFKLQEGPLSGSTGAPLPHTFEPQLRKWGMPTKLNKGVVELLSDFTVCQEGDVLGPNQSAILRTFGVKMASFQLKLLAAWSAEGERSRQPLLMCGWGCCIGRAGVFCVETGGCMLMV